MKINSRSIAEVWEVFLDRTPTLEEAESISKKSETWADVTAELLLNTEFLSLYSNIRVGLKGAAIKVTRCLLDQPENFILQVESEMHHAIRKRLFERQVEYARKASELVQLEREILNLKRLFQNS